MDYTAWYCILTYAVVGSLALLWTVGLFIRVRAPNLDLRKAHVIVTGGSTGIGLAIAIALARKGANVTIISRTLTTLQDAVATIKAKTGKDACYCTADVSNVAALQKAIDEDVVKHGGRLDAIVCCAGYSHPQRFEQLSSDIFRKQMDVNYHGVVNACLSALPHLRRTKGPRRISIVSSMAAVACISGFSAYSPTKAAVRAFAQCLDMELHPHGIRCQLINPPDVDTPGYREEMKIKPRECNLISEGSGLWKAEDIAEKAVTAMETYQFEVNYGMDGFLLGSYFVGFQPVTSATWFLVEIVIMAVVRVVAGVLISSWYGIVRKVYAEEEKGAKSNYKTLSN